MEVIEPTLIPAIPEISPDTGFPYKKILFFWVILIAAILPVIYFVSSLKNTDADITRIAHLSLIREKIDDTLNRGGKIPLPTNALELNFWEIKLGYQWRAGKDLFLSLGLELMKDPETGEMYHYFIRPETKEYEIVAILSDKRYSNFTIGETPAYSLGSSKWRVLIMNSGKNKWQLVSAVLKNAQKVDLWNEQKRNQIWWQSQKSCQEILVKQPSSNSGKYVIEMWWTLISVYCDMKTDNGWWTLFYANNWHPNSELKMSYVNLRDALDLKPFNDLSNYDEPNLVWMVDYRLLTENWAKEMLIRNKKWDSQKWVKFTFSSPNILNWALWEKVLGRTNKWCTDIPWKATWSIINQDWTIKYDNLNSIMNHTGVSWWVSHEKYWCNDYIWNANPHLAFYSANGVKEGERTRTTDGVWGAWGGENEYRYFIR